MSQYDNDARIFKVLFTDVTSELTPSLHPMLLKDPFFHPEFPATDKNCGNNVDDYDNNIRGNHNNKSTNDSHKIINNRDVHINESTRKRLVGRGVCIVCWSISDDLRFGTDQRLAVSKCAKCLSVFYCSKDCQRIHWPFHRPNCRQKPAPSLAIPSAAPKDIDGGIPRRAFATAGSGIRNLGNSCYLSASLQALSHIAPLSCHLLSGRFAADLNTANRDGSGNAALLLEYVTFLRDLWLGSVDAGQRPQVVAPSAIKRVLGRLNPDYAGFAQHDAHDLLELLLDR